MTEIAWGNNLCEFLHYASFKYPIEPDAIQQAGTLAFLQSLVYMIPCDVCRTHYASHIASTLDASDVQNRTAFIKWVAQLHNDVNKSLQRSQWKLDRVKQKYDRRTCDCEAPPQKNKVATRVGKRGMCIILGILAAALAVIIFVCVWICTLGSRSRPVIE